MIEAIIFAFFIKTFFFADLSSFAVTAAKLKTPGAETQQLMAELKDAHFKPVLSQKIKRAPFSAQGALIGVSGDNIQVFEYPNHESAVHELQLLTQKYGGANATATFKQNIHLYIRDALIIFYMGSNESILAELNNNKIFSDSTPPLTLSSISR